MRKLKESPKGLIDRMKARSRVLERVSDIWPYCGEPYFVILCEDGLSVSAHGDSI